VAQASEEIMARQILRVAIPKRFSIPAREIWQMQSRFDNRRGAARLLAHPRFRAAYDFLLLRARAGEAPQELADWWTAAQAGQPIETPPGEADAPQDELPSGAPPRRRRRRRRGGGGGGGGGGGQHHPPPQQH
jgi:poly(A) polymerase